mgnify:CR=1 FL=1
MVIHYYMHLYALVIFVNVDLTSLQIPNKINSSGVQTTLSKKTVYHPISFKKFTSTVHTAAPVRATRRIGVKP